MADKIDRFFIDYFSGKLSKLLNLRKMELQAKTVDDNVNASKSTTLTRGAEFQLIREQGDNETAFIAKELQYMDVFLSTLSSEQQELLTLRYDRRNRLTWSEVAYRFCKSERQCIRQVRDMKDEFEECYWSQMVGNTGAQLEKTNGVMAG